jgi:Domain of unknown function (DUF4157)
MDLGLPKIDIPTPDDIRRELERVARQAAEALAQAERAAREAAEATARAMREATEAAARAAAAATEASAKAATAPTDFALALINGDAKAAEAVVSGLVRTTSETATAIAQLGSFPYFLAADITRDIGGDGIKIFRGGINGKLVEINIVPFILQKLARLDAQTPEEIAAAILTAPIEVILAAYLQAALDTLEPSASQIPKSIKRLLEPHYQASVLNEAKYIVSSFGLTLPEAINGTRVFMGDHAFAVTVGHLIIFSREPNMSDSDIHWWAHELEHVAQYQQWGIDGFASRYVNNFNEVEAAAEAKAKEVDDAL